ncbi:MAG: alanine--tRNA ligase [bacterium]|nr:alanine--tRNA ligase [bacterium]
MSSVKLRQEFLKFFEKKGHKIVPSSSLIPTDQSVLFTSAGMQQFKPYYLGEPSPYGKNVVSCQKCFRTSDIEEVGDESHLTFLEMLGSFSFSRALAKGKEEDLSSSPGGYFKEEAIKLAYEFLFKELKFPLEKAFFTVFEGDPSTGSEQAVPPDEESILIWKKLGVPEDKIKKFGRADNFWGPTGEEGPCGPTTEIYLNGIEVWNLVFNEYYQNRDKKLAPLAQKGVDTGMGFERLAMTVQNKSNVFETDLFLPIIQKIEGGDEKAKRIIADHIKGAVFLSAEGILPSNVERGYVLRRILRRAIRYGKLLDLPENFLIPLAKIVIEIYKDVYPEIQLKEADILTIIRNEEEKFEKTLETGLKELQKLMSWYIDEGLWDKTSSQATPIEDAERLGEKLFDIFQKYGFPLELSLEEIEKMAKEIEYSISNWRDEIIKGFNKSLGKHQEISRAGAEKKFGGAGIRASYKAVKLHTATHLLHSALRKVLGEHVRQMGSDITAERLRFDFVHSQKMTDKELKETEALVNQKIKEDLEVKKEEMKYGDALKIGALAFFREKYPERVTVYSITSPAKRDEGKKRTQFSSPGDFSKEICAGPHAKKTSELGSFKIVKEESSGAGVRRIRAILK